MSDLPTQLHEYGRQLDEEARPLSVTRQLGRAGARPPVLARPWAAAVLAAIGTLILIGAAALLLRGGSSQPADPVSQIPEAWATWTAADGTVGDCACEMIMAADGTVWLVGFDGIARFTGETWERIQPPRPFSGEGWPSIAQSPDGSIWVSGMSYIAQYRDGVWGPIIESGYGVDAGDPVFFEGLWVDEDGIVWTGLMDETGVIEDGRFILRAEPEPLDEQGYTPPEGLSIAATSPDGSVWMTMGDSIIGVEGALVEYDGESLTRYSLGGVGFATFESDGTGWFLVPEVGQDGWLSGKEQWSEPGLYRLDGDIWYRITTEDGLGGYRIKSMLVAPDGALWFATVDGTVTRYQPGTDPGAGVVVDIESRPFTDADVPPPAYPEPTTAP